jgi:hypothetical protein
MGIGVSAWYNPSGSVAPDELAATYAEFAVRMLGAGEGAGEGQTPSGTSDLRRPSDSPEGV